MDIAYRPATEGDLELMLAWRSNPEIYRNLYSQDQPLEWGDHIEWWESRVNQRDWIIMIHDRDRWRSIGVVNLTDLDTDLPELGVWIGEVSLWGNGLATEAIEFAIDWLREQDYTEARARILDQNEASKRVFEKNGFYHSGPAVKESKSIE